MPVPTPCLQEQQAITEEVATRLSVTEELETTIETNLKRAERFRQTILQQAFTGGLLFCDTFCQ
jgi:type I restriction enzyme S subunit